MENVHFMTGHHGVGKTYIVNQLNEEIDLFHFDTGPTIRSIYSSLCLPYSLGEWVRRGEEEKGKNFTNELLLNALKDLLVKVDSNKKIIITGNRSLNGLMYLSNGIYVPKPNIIFIDACKRILKDNYCLREKKDLTDEMFEEILQAEINSGIGEIKEYTINHPEECLYVYKESNNDDTYQKVLRKINGKGDR